MGKSHLLIKEDGVLAGVEMAKKVFARFDPTMKVEVLLQDGAIGKHHGMSTASSQLLHHYLILRGSAFIGFISLSGFRDDISKVCSPGFSPDDDEEDEAEDDDALSLRRLSDDADGEFPAGAATGFCECMRISLICSRNISFKVV